LHLKGDVGWSGSSGEHGEQETLYHAGRGVVRVLGREYALPTGDRTLVLLIDEHGADAAQAVSRRVVIAPVVPRRAGEEPPARPGMWAELLQDDPDVRAFTAQRNAP
jgi:hypothetical protein